MRIDTVEVSESIWDWSAFMTMSWLYFPLLYFSMLTLSLFMLWQFALELFINE